MSALLRNVANCIWHAFDALQDSALVHKSKLKVLTANLGTLLDLYGVEKGLDHYKSTPELNFGEYKHYLQCEVFGSLPSSLSLSQLRDYETKISEVCWLVCRRKLIQRENPLFEEDSLFMLFRIFCLLGDLVQDQENTVSYEVTLQPSEAGLVAEQLVDSLGLCWDGADWENLSSSFGHFKWNTFTAVLEAKYCGCGQDRAAILEAVEELHDIFIKDIIKKGYLMKKGYLLPTMREYWFVLQPCELTYYKSCAEKEQCGRIALDKHCSVEASSQDQGKMQRMTLVTPERTFELATQDHKSRLQWVSALQLAISTCDGDIGYQRGARARRRGAGARREREVRETRARLQHEIQARLAAEAQAQELTVMAEADSKKLLELRNAQTTLEKLLQEETQAKRDEEIVRSLQARVLAEEWEKREELERLQEEQSRMLEEERLKRAQFERLQAEKEAQYREASERLKQLEAERQRLDAELRSAQSKIRLTEDTAQALTMQLRETNPALRSGERARRALSFVPTVKSSSDSLINMRTSSLRHNGNEIITRKS